MKTTLKMYSFHGKFSVFSALIIPFKLKIYNYSRRQYSESMVHNGSKIDIIILINCFIIFHSALVHCENLYWYIDKGVYYTNARSLFFVVEKYYYIDSELMHNILSIKFCCVEECSIYNNDNFGRMNSSCPIIYITESKFIKEINETTVVMDDLYLFGWVVLKIDESMINNFNKLLVKLCATKKEDWERLVYTDMDRSIFNPSNFKMIV